jgi:nicotinamide phosphoribosyltransferase
MGEKQYVLNMIEKFAKPGAVFAMVADTYNIFEFCEMLGTDDEIRKKIESHGKTGGLVVVRPDSGNPSEVVVNCLRILDRHFGHTVNTKGYRVLNTVRVIQGDGIDHASIRSILFCMELAGYSADNVAFGQGGALGQMVNRDTMKFAMKCSAARIRGNWVHVYKDPVTDSGKASKRGRVTLYQDRDGTYRSGVEDWETPVLQVVYENGELRNQTTFEEVRQRARGK